MDNKQYKHIHFIGLGGIGMSAIAEILLKSGYQVSGSDQGYSDRLEALEAEGATIYIGQKEENLTDDIDVVVRSTAIPATNPEIIAAERKGIPVLHRSQMLAYLMEEKKAVCVAGSHGKTTTSSMVSLIFERCGLDPTIVVGGVINEIGSNAKYGKSDWLVAEADESDGSLVNLLPYVGVVTNIEEDHLDHYKDINAIREVFLKFIKSNHPDGLVILSADCPEALKLKEYSKAPVVTYGFNPEADYVLKNIQHEGMINHADLYYHGELLGTITLQIPGEHNLSNAAAAVICGLFAGLAFDDIVAALKEFHGTKRRFQLQGIVNDIMVIDDYAHHPTEIKATVRAARNSHSGRLLVVFQPHRYSRTQFLAKAFAEALNEADKVFLMEVYPAGEQPIPGVSSQLIADYMSECGKTATVLKEETLSELVAQAAKPGDMILVMGAGSIYKEATLIVQELEDRFSTGA